MPDVVVIGAGPTELVAADLLADEGWSVEVLKEQPEPGGAVRHDREVDPESVNDLFSSVSPFAAASPVLRRPRLGDHGLRRNGPPGDARQGALPRLGLHAASASAHTGGGVHGAPGANAARAAPHRQPLSGLTRAQRVLTRRDRTGRRTPHAP